MKGMEPLDEILKRIDRMNSTKNTSENKNQEVENNLVFDCKICNNTRWFVEEPFENAPASQRKIIACECQEKIWSNSSNNRLKEYSQLESFERFTFDNIELGTNERFSEPSSFRKAYHEAQKFVANKEGWLIITGPSGTGKTHLAAAIGNALLEQGDPVKFISIPNLLDHFRSALSSETETNYDDTFQQTIEAPILILDDLSVNNLSGWAEEKLDQILTHRYNRRMPTIVTTSKYFYELNDRFRTRLSDPYFSSIINIQPGRNIEQILGTGLSKKIREKMTFENFATSGAQKSSNTQKRSLKEAYEVAKIFAEEPSGWLYLAGPTGVGKTHLAISIMNESTNNNFSVLFKFLPDLLDDLRTSYGPNGNDSFDKVFNQVKNVDLLILDDLGTEASTPWAEEKLYQIIVHRYDLILPTVFTSRITLESIGNKNNLITNKYSDAIVSRLSDANVVTERYLSAPDFRNRG